MVVHLPLVGLELNRGGRRKSLYLLRTAPAIACFLILIVGLDQIIRVDDAGTSAESVGSLLRNVLLLFQVAAALFAAPLFSAGAIARERQENTLNLLLLANCRAHDLVLAKTLAAFIQSELLILSCLPLQGIAAFLGGITIQASLYDLAVISAVNLAMTTTGVFVSALTRRAPDAYMVILGFGIAACACVGTLLPSFSPFVDDSQKTWWIGVPMILACCAVAIVTMLSSIALLRGAHDTARARKPNRIAKPLTIPWQPRSLRLSPIARLFSATANECGAGMLQGPSAIVVLIISIVVAFIPFGIVGLLVMLIVAYDTATVLTSAQRKGDLDLLFVTAARDDALARGILHTQFKRALVFLPALAINASLTTFVAFLQFRNNNFAISHLDGAIVLALMGAVTLGDALARLLLIAAIACSCASSSPSISSFTAAIQYFVVMMLLGCFGGASIGIAVDMLGSLNESGGSSALVTLPMAVIIFCMTSLRWLVTLSIAYVAFRTFEGTVQTLWRPGRGTGFSLGRE